MTSIAKPELVQFILEALRNEPKGLSRSELQAKAGQGDIPGYAFRALLADLEARGLIRSSGRTKDRLYHLAIESPEGAASLSVGAFGEVETYPPLSAAAREVQALLALPVGQRSLVGYQRGFLDAYRPNDTHYLSDGLRTNLASLGGPREPDHPAGTYARQILQNLLVDLSWASSHLEGNTYSLLDTERLIQLGQQAEGKDAQETQMILNHKAAIEYLVDSAEALDVSPTTIKNLQALLMENLLGDPNALGRLRTTAVRIGGTTYLPLAMPQIIEECFRQILHLADAITDPFEQAFFLLVHLPYLQPFLDGNKRTARLAANIPFIRQNCIPVTFMDVAPAAFTDGMLAVYETNRIELLRDVFVYAYERSCARYGVIRSALGEPDPFRIQYRSQIKAIVREVVLALPDDQRALAQIKAYINSHIPKDAGERFLAVIETELTGLHDGNYARYRLRPSEFAAWSQAKAIEHS
jgi:Fic family protein